MPNPFFFYQRVMTNLDEKKRWVKSINDFLKLPPNLTMLQLFLPVKILNSIMMLKKDWLSRSRTFCKPIGLFGK